MVGERVEREPNGIARSRWPACQADYPSLSRLPASRHLVTLPVHVRPCCREHARLRPVGSEGSPRRAVPRSTARNVSLEAGWKRAARCSRCRSVSRAPAPGSSSGTSIRLAHPSALQFRCLLPPLGHLAERAADTGTGWFQGWSRTRCCIQRIPRGSDHLAERRISLAWPR